MPSSSSNRHFGDQLERLRDPESVVEPDIDPVPRQKSQDKGKGREEGDASGSSLKSEKKHSPFIGFAAGLCSG
jgi:hypothetical protein